MKTCSVKTILIACLLSLLWAGSSAAADGKTRSEHIGFLYPAGVDVAGYTSETRIRDNVYRYYTFGFPSLAAIGFSYYSRYDGNGFIAMIGFALGPGANGAIGYQLRFDKLQYLKLGLGFAQGIAYSGVFPAFSYEHRY